MLGDHSLNHSLTPKPVGITKLSRPENFLLLVWLIVLLPMKALVPQQGTRSPAAIFAEVLALSF